ncbi:hypothetical protein RDI58_019670 [Solanum bulbocastanum]|uniref:Reverse transcriptase zinc-binding domain-containing protein n=1 Tax=Solanum bulbocastanum TaxID=147425 RepID=A0AAN8T5P4_SOLBU
MFQIDSNKSPGPDGYGVDFTKKLGYKPTWKLAALVWMSMALPKHRFLMWLAVQGRLLTQERKLRLQIQVDDTACCLCAEKMGNTGSYFKKRSWQRYVELSFTTLGVPEIGGDTKANVYRRKKQLHR